MSRRILTFMLAIVVALVNPAVMSDTLRGEAKFYKCVAGKLIAITEEEAVALGYVKE